jgi:hypothetical protein
VKINPFGFGICPRETLSPLLEEIMIVSGS